MHAGCGERVRALRRLHVVPALLLQSVNALSGWLCCHRHSQLILPELLQLVTVLRDLLHNLHCRLQRCALLHCGCQALCCCQMQLLPLSLHVWS